MMKRWLDFIAGVPLVALLSFFSKKNRAIGEPKRILIIKLAAIGDTILLIPVLRSFRDAHPHAHIDWLISPVNRAIAETVPYVDGTPVWKGSSLRHLMSLVRRLRAERYDAVVDLEQWARGTALLAFFSGAPFRAGFDTPGQHRAGLFTATVKKNYKTHELFDFYEALSTLGALTRQPGLELWESDEGRVRARELIPDLERPSSGRRRVLLHPGCGSDGLPREWPLENYAVLGHWLQKKYDAELFLSSGPEELEKTAVLNRLLQNGARDVGGLLSWQGMISLVANMDLVISGNTGVMHIAAALKKKQVALHGPTDPALWGPINPNAEIVRTACDRCPCLRLGFEYHVHDQSCMKKIDVETVKAAVSRLFDNPEQI